MHIYFSGIGGTAIGPLAMIAAQAGYTISGSDKRDSHYVQYLRKHGVSDVHIGQDYQQIMEVNAKNPIDWFVYSSAVSIENPDAPELKFCAKNSIKVSKRDELLNQIIADKKLKLIAVAGTHGKTTTTAMLIWLFKRLNIPVSYSVGAKISYGEMGQYAEKSEYFVYEADEFDHNFLAFRPYLSLITGIDYDHHEQYPSPADYQQAFQDFLNQSKRAAIWQKDALKLNLAPQSGLEVLDDSDKAMDKIQLLGLVNRQNAWLVVKAVQSLTNVSVAQLISHINAFPGLSRRFEQITPNLYSDYAHTPSKIHGCLQTAQEQLQKQCERLILSQKSPITPVANHKNTTVKGLSFHKDLRGEGGVVVVYEPLTDRRQHYIKHEYSDLFDGVKKLYWVPSYLAREDPNQPVLTPTDLIKYMDNKQIAEPSDLNPALKTSIQNHLDVGDLVVCISGGGGDSLDEWLRANFVT